MTGRPAIPVNVVTGFLGAGKSTLLNRLLRAPELSNALVIVNEWGEIGLDHLLIEKVEGDVILLSSGCLCCSLRGDLVEAMRDLIGRRDKGEIAPFGRIVIETSGLAEPAPILQALLSDIELAHRIAFAGMATVVDAVNGAATLQQRRESRRQVALADRLAIAKSDLLPEPERAAMLGHLRKQLRALNPVAEIADVAAGEFTAADLVSIDPFAHSIAAQPTPAHHVDLIRAYNLRIEDPVSAADFATFLRLLRDALGPKLLRVKGLVALAEHPDEPLVIHGVQHIFHSPRRLKAWPDKDRSTRIVAIVDDLEQSVVDRLWSALAGAPQIDRPDLAALADNPLALSRAGGIF